MCGHQEATPVVVMAVGAATSVGAPTAAQGCVGQHACTQLREVCMCAVSIEPALLALDPCPAAANIAH